ncbi:hypothetical protein [Desertimonas flava]|uniref:hypothetical protein n=1 Tax=Desertimonas flava TaxID=2064846 RepID=UPI000E346643|nr:hypothetical protein [Desertimonas flava]
MTSNQGSPDDPPVDVDEAAARHLPGTGRQVLRHGGDGPAGQDCGVSVGERMPIQEGDRGGAGPVAAVFGRFRGGMGARGIAAALNEVVGAMFDDAAAEVAQHARRATPAHTGSLAQSIRPRQYGKHATGGHIGPPTDLARRFPDAIETTEADS